MPQIEKKYIDPDIVLVEIAGRITLGRECQAVEWMVDELIRDNQKKVVFDLSGLEHVDSTGIGILVMCCGKMQAAGGGGGGGAFQPKGGGGRRVPKLNQIMVFYPTAAAAAENFELPQ